MHSMRAFCVGVAAVLLGSCSSVGTYVEPAEGAPVATLVGEDPSLFEGLDPLRTVSTTWFVRVDEHSLSRSAWSGYPNELRVAPGPHEVEVGGDRWWGGFTALLTVRNDAASPLEGWTHTFRSSHAVAGAPWGVEIESTRLDDGFYEHVIRGVDWARAIPAQGAVEVGFNGTQGRAIGDSGPLDEAMLFDGGASCH